jgi:hypothetical protein
MSIAYLRYGKLSNGERIPGCFALECEDGKSILFQADYDLPELANDLGAFIDQTYDTETAIEQANLWLHDRVGEAFNITHTYAELLDEPDES